MLARDPDVILGGSNAELSAWQAWPQLHAVRLGLVHPASGKSVHWEAGVPDDFADLLEALDLDPDADVN